MTACRKFEDLMARYLHGGILLQEKEALEQHLAACSRCERLYRDVSEIDHRLRNAPASSAEPPPWLRARILANLPDVPPAVPFHVRWGRLGPPLGAAAACALVATSLFLLRQSPSPAVRTAAVAPSTASAPAPPAAQAPLPAEGGRGRDVPAASRERNRPVPVATASAPKVKIIREVRIYLYYPDAQRVAVTGDFNGWDPQGVPLKPGGKPGLWETELRLSPGAYAYNFIVDDDVLVPDPGSSEQMPDGYGGTNSILLVKEGRST